MHLFPSQFCNLCNGQRISGGIGVLSCKLTSMVLWISLLYMAFKYTVSALESEASFSLIHLFCEQNLWREKATWAAVL